MKKNILKGSALLLVGAMAVIACKKEAVEVTKTSEAETCTLTGTLFAQLDPNTVALEKVPDGTVVVAKRTINGKPYTYKTVTTGGVYTLTIPVGREATTYDVNFSSFTADEVQPTGQTPATRSFKWQTNNSTSLALIGGVTKTLDATYAKVANSGDNANSFAKTKIEGYAKYNKDEVNDTLPHSFFTMPYSYGTYTISADSKRVPKDARLDDESVVSGTKVFLTVGTARYETTTGSDGKFSFEIDITATTVGTLSFENFKGQLHQYKDPTFTSPTPNAPIYEDVTKIWNKGDVTINLKPGNKYLPIDGTGVAPGLIKIDEKGDSYFWFQY